ncbi:MAG: ATP-dependent zinc metalloprotease FtsH [Firmicutes bacterium]|nr:ATP-dependent zinc metalloprotease FtsH [Bacillota bacterium]
MKKFGRGFGAYILIFLMVLGAAYFYKDMATTTETKEVKFSQFASHLEAGDFEKINITDRQLTGTKKNGNVEIAYAPSALEINWLEEKYIYPQLEAKELVMDSDPPQSDFSLLNILPTILMIVAMLFLFYFLMNQGGNKQAFQFGKNKARLYKGGGKKITFDDVAGLEEEKQELEEIVDFLKSPQKYTKLGARIPKGVLLVGSPGTGKTYISKATAGEAGVPFFTISGSDFVEMFVGVGASRVRDLFTEAKKNAPCIVFIDEIDAVGRKRGAGLGGGNDEREQTLNQLLVEMDGFDGNLGIIILAATNRPDVLDPALLRPGRFDRQIVIGMPDVKGREEILKLYTKNKPLDEDVKLDVLAKRTAGFSPADIENLINEAALLTARRNGIKIRMDEIEEATTKVMAGPAKKSRVISDEEKKLTAYHEAGHAIVMRATPDSDPVHQITIIPRGTAGGFTMWLPEKDRFFATKGHMLNSIKHLLGGRVAEELKLDDISTGASNDLQRATQTARSMITDYGFSEKLGPVSFNTGEEVFLGRDFSSRQNYSEEVASTIDKEVKRILEECYEETRKILVEHDDAFERVAQALLLVETLDGEQFEALYKGELSPEELQAQVKVKEEEIKKNNEEEAKEAARLEEEELQRAREALKVELDRQSDQYVTVGADEEEDRVGYEMYKRATAKPKTLTKDSARKLARPEQPEQTAETKTTEKVEEDVIADSNEKEDNSQE